MSRMPLMTVLGLVSFLILSGCTAKQGVVRLNTEPRGAKYFVDGIEKGTTPAEFEWDVSRPILLEIRKEGYHSEQELLNKGWLQFQISQGNYGEIRIGKVTYKWTVTINRKLKSAPPGVASGIGGQ